METYCTYTLWFSTSNLEGRNIMHVYMYIGDSPIVILEWRHIVYVHVNWWISPNELELKNTIYFYVMLVDIYHKVVQLFFIVSSIRSFPDSWLTAGLVTRVTRQVSLVEQELSALPEHLSSPPVLREVQVLLFCVVLCWPLFVHLLHLWYLHTLLKMVNHSWHHSSNN